MLRVNRRKNRHKKYPRSKVHNISGKDYKKLKTQVTRLLIRQKLANNEEVNKDEIHKYVVRLGIAQLRLLYNSLIHNKYDIQT